MVMGMNGVVCANSPLAAQAGLDVLRSGGNAADAAVAVSLALGVVEPAMSGLGGDGFFHFHSGVTGKGTVLNGSGPTPAKATRELFAGQLHEGGPLSVSVPGKLAGLGALHAAFGSVAWRDLVQPVADLARAGFGMSHHLLGFADDARQRLERDARSAVLFLGRQLGDLCRNEDLARTLEEIAEGGSETFYRGPLARRLATAFAEAGVLVGAQDLAALRCEAEEPIEVSYRGLTVRQTGPNSTGFAMLQMLKILEHFDFADLSLADQIHVSVEAKKLAFVDRDRYSIDPRFGEVPLEQILSDEYTGKQAAQIRMDRAAMRPMGRAALESDTTYFCVVDAHGNGVSGIQSHASTFGSGVMAGDTGILLNNRMGWWEWDKRLRNHLQPGKRISHTMNAPVILKDERLWGLLGTPGADNQVQVNMQTLTSMHDLGMDPQTAVERPRWISSQPGQGVSWRNVGNGKLAVEEDVGPDVLEALVAKDHVLDVIPHIAGPCAAQAIQALPNGMLLAGSDPRRDGWAAAY